MTDSEKLDLLLEKVIGLDQKVTGLDQKVTALDEKTTGLEIDLNAVKRQIMKSTAELKAMDEILLDEIERVHSILDQHKADSAAHTA